MCYDKQSSLTAWAIAYVFATMLYFRNQGNDRWIAVFIFTYAFVQLLEAGMWKSIDENDNKTNDFYTRMMLIAIWMQPVVMMLGKFVWGRNTPFLKFLNPTYTNYLFNAIFIIVILFLLDSFRRVSDPSLKFQAYRGENGHLVWTEGFDPKIDTIDNFWFINKKHPWIAQLVYAIGIFLPLIFMTDFARTIMLGGIIFVSLIYNYFKYYHTGEFSTMWCYHSIAMSIAAWFI
jgi:hypothetical protein